MGMNVRERQRKEVPGFVQKSDYTFPIVYGDEKVCTDYGVRPLPHLVVIDKEGIVRYVHIGYSPDLAEKLGWQVESLLK